MGAWAKDQKTQGKIRMLGDGSANWAKSLGLELDLTARNFGTRMNRCSMFVDNGVVKSLNVEAAGKFEVSNAETMLGQI
jgi:peroxiredoxin